MPLRKEMGLSINIRPITIYEGLESLSPLNANLAKGVQLTFLRELNSGMYLVNAKKIPMVNGRAMSVTMLKMRCERIAKFGFELSRQTGQKITSIDKANVLVLLVFSGETVSQTYIKSLTVMLS